MKPKPGPPPDLAYFWDQKIVNRGSPLWAHISGWQRKDWVRLKWNESAEIAWVRLTPTGRAEVERQRQRKEERARAAEQGSGKPET